MLTGTRLGVYDVQALLGAGGMGEVYRAHDTKLGRDVAIKILPEALAQDPERRARFEREARMLAALHHPHIAQIFGLEGQDGRDGQDGSPLAIVMELVEGPTLAERLDRGPLALTQVLTIARQLADALDAAHERGVVHRDLKPANIKIAKDGGVKVLDFGLAMPVAGDGAASAATVRVTEPGTIVGTAAYMSPEQARGQAVDKRTDIWAFGCVLYEMLTGKPAFDGATASDVMANVLQKEPVWDALPAATPASVKRVIARCLEKDQKHRLRDIGDVRADLDAREAPQTSSPRTELPAPQAGIWIAAIVLVAATTGIAVWRLKPAPTASRPVTHVTMTLTAADLDIGQPRPAIALSPDGTLFVYVAANPKRLIVQSLVTGQTKTLPGTEGARDPFFSTDGRWLGFFADRKLKKVAVDGGSPQVIADAPNPRGGSWQQDGSIVFAPLNDGPLLEVSSAGGAPRELTALDGPSGEFSHRWPHAVSGGVVFSVANSAAAWEGARIVAYSRSTRRRQTLVESGTYPQFAGGYLIYSRSASLSAVAFDPDRLQVTGTPVPVVDHVWQNFTNGGASFAVSAAGVFAFVPGGLEGANRTLVWVDRRGEATPLGAPMRPYERASLSPDGNRVATAISGSNQDIWMYDVVRRNLSRVTFEGSHNYPVWTPDGSKLAFEAVRPGLDHILWLPADGGSEAPLLSENATRVPDSWNREGSTLVYSERNQKTGWDLWMLPLRGDAKPAQVLQTPFDEDAGMISPDGHWLAYVSNETGRSEVYVRAFPPASGKWPVSTDGGREPVWSRDGRELFYRTGAGGRMMRAAVTTGATFSAGRPEFLFDGPFQVRPASSHAAYDVSLDGRRFLMIQDEAHEPTTSRVNLVMNWLDELRQRVR